MSDENLALVVGLAKLIAVNEYLRECGNEHVCIVLDDVVDAFKTALQNLKQK